MSINEKLFAQVYEECLSVIDATNDASVKRKRKKFEAAYQSMCKELDPEHTLFNSCVHELRTYQYLIDKGFSVSAANDNKAGPDFNVEGLGYVECVICTRGEPGTEEQLAGESNRYRAALPRITTAIKEKRSKYAEYLCQGKISPDIPRIIAVSTTIFSNEVHRDLMVDLAKQILYGIGCEVINYNAIAKQFESTPGREVHCYDNQGKKTSEKELDLDYFSRPEYQDISAVIIANNSIGDKLTDDCFFVFLNPNATVPIPEEIAKKLKCFERCGEDSYRWNS